jgi:noranthrone synthase
MLSAAAISCSRTLSELLPAAVQTVVVAFHAGLCALDVRNRIEQSIEVSSEWSMVVPGLVDETASKVLKEFSQANVSFLPLHPSLVEFIEADF